MSNPKFVWAIRDTSTGTLISAKCSGGKFYLRESDAKNRLLYSYHNHQNYKIVRFELVEVG